MVANNVVQQENKKLVPPVLRPLPAPRLELHGNPSEFGVFAQVRQIVLERQLRNVLRDYSQRMASDGAGSDSDDDEDVSVKVEIPKVESESCGRDVKCIITVVWSLYRL